jgi:hypothetical protein
MSETKANRASPDDHLIPKHGTWGMFRFTQRDVERAGWRGKAGLLRNLDNWLTKCQPDSIDDIQAIWLENPFQNYVATIYCKAGRGHLSKQGPIVSIDIPWRDPDVQKKDDPNQELLLALGQAMMRVIGVCYGAGSHTLYLITAGPKSKEVRKKIQHIWTER